MFLVGVMCSISILIVNLVVFMLGKQSNIDPTIVIIIGSIAVGVIVLPLLGFLIFHFYLTFSGRTTREIIKKINVKSESNKIISNNTRDINVQWCSVDDSIIDFF